MTSSTSCSLCPNWPARQGCHLVTQLLYSSVRIVQLSKVKTTKKCPIFIISAKSMLLLWKEQHLEWILLRQYLSGRWRVVRQTSPVVVSDTTEILGSSTLSSSLCWQRQPCLYSTQWSIAIDLTLELLSLLSEHILTQRWISVSNPFRSRRY